MSECLHEKTTEQTLSRQLKDNTFEIKGSVCETCGSELWTDSMSKQWMKWVSQLKPIRIQFTLSSAAEQCLYRLLEEMPTQQHLTLAKVLISIFTTLYKNGHANSLSKVYDNEKFLTLETQGDGKNIGFDVKPILFLDLESLADLHDLKYNEMAKEALNLMLAICFTKDNELHEYWESEVLPRIHEALKIA